jgi:hypothetical protein
MRGMPMIGWVASIREARSPTARELRSMLSLKRHLGVCLTQLAGTTTPGRRPA